MIHIHAPNGDIFETEVSRQMIDVTSMSRPDPNWRFTDRNGHLHQWYSEGKPATDYDPLKSYDIPSVTVRETEPYWCVDCLDEHTRRYYVCSVVGCEEVIEPGTTPDMFTQYIPGLRDIRYLINKQNVTPEEFKNRLMDQFPEWKDKL